ncbi:hypothetical protein [Terrisporobacter sp.]
MNIYTKNENIVVNKLIAYKKSKDGILVEKFVRNTALELERDTGIHNGQISRAVNLDISSQRGSKNKNGEKYFFSKGDEYIETIPYIDLDNAKKNNKWKSGHLKQKEKIENLELLGIDVIKIENGKYTCRCMKCKEQIEKEFKYSRLIDNSYCLCEKCLRNVKRNNIKLARHNNRKLIDDRPEIFTENGGPYTYYKELNNNIDLKDVLSGSDKEIILTCSNCGKNIPKKPTVLTKNMKRGKKRIPKCPECKKIFNKTKRTIKEECPALLNIIDYEKAKKELGLAKKDIENLIVTSKDRLPVFCIICNTSNYGVLNTLRQQNKDGIKLCQKCKNLLKTSYHHIYLLEYLKAQGHDVEAEQTIKVKVIVEGEVEEKFLYIDIKDNTDKKTYEIQGEEHEDENNYYNLMEAKRKKVTGKEILENKKKNDKAKEEYVINEIGYEHIKINLKRGFTIVDMLNQLFNLNLKELPKMEIDWNKYDKLKVIKSAQDLVNKGCSVKEIAEIVGVRTNTIYEHIKNKLIKIPQNSNIKKSEQIRNKKIEKAQELIYKQYKLSQVAKEINIDVHTLYDWIDKNKLDMSLYNVGFRGVLREKKVNKAKELKEQGYLLKDIAKIINVSKSTLSKWNCKNII